MSTLYSRDILRLAASLAPADLSDAAATERRAPLCGSRMRAAADVGPDGTVTAVRFQAHACALGQASAAMLAVLAKGRDRDGIVALRRELAATLAGTIDSVTFVTFAPARAASARHGAILLPYDALLAALAPAAAGEAA